MTPGDFARRRELIGRRARSGDYRRKAMAHLVRQAGAVAVVIDRRLIGYRLPCGGIACVKRRFASEAAAMAEINAAALVVSFQSAHRIPIRAYRCPYCGAWHLTSKQDDRA